MKPKQMLTRTSSGWRLAKKTPRTAEPVESVTVVPGIAVKIGGGLQNLIDSMTVVAAKPVATTIDSSKYKVNPIRSSLPAFTVQPVDDKEKLFSLMSNAFEGKGVKSLRRV